MSSETRIVEQAAWCGRYGYHLSDLQARVIASRWHGGQASPLYSLASTGSTGDMDSLLSEIERDVEEAGDDVTEADALRGLAGYVVAAGRRGPVLGWSDLRW